MEGASNKIAVIVVTLKIDTYLKPCLDSLINQSYPLDEIIVIDNSFNKDFRLRIIKDYPNIKLYSPRKRLSYCESLNLGISLSKGDFTLCLNDDVILDKDFVKEALKGFLVDKRVGMVSGKVLRYDKTTIDSTGLFLSLWRTAQERGYGLKDKGQFKENGFIFGVNGAVGFYRRQMLEDIKEKDEYFDSRFRFFYEDLDLAWRANRKGWNGYYISTALAYHLRGGTVREKIGINKRWARCYLNDELHLDLLKNRYLVIFKNESLKGFLTHLPFIILYDFLIWSYILIYRPKLIIRFILKLGYLKTTLKEKIL